MEWPRMVLSTWPAYEALEISTPGSHQNSVAVLKGGRRWHARSVGGCFVTQCELPMLPLGCLRPRLVEQRPARHESTSTDDGVPVSAPAITASAPSAFIRT